MAATLALALSAPASFGTFAPGVERDYAADTMASVTSTAGTAELSVSDLAEHGLVGGGPLRLLTYDGPVANDPVSIAFRQHVGAGQALRTRTYAKTLTFTLATAMP